MSPKDGKNAILWLSVAGRLAARDLPSQKDLSDVLSDLVAAHIMGAWCFGNANGSLAKTALDFSTILPTTLAGKPVAPVKGGSENDAKKETCSNPDTKTQMREASADDNDNVLPRHKQTLVSRQDSAMSRKSHGSQKSNSSQRLSRSKSGSSRKNFNGRGGPVGGRGKALTLTLTLTLTLSLIGCTGKVRMLSESSLISLDTVKKRALRERDPRDATHRLASILMDFCCGVRPPQLPRLKNWMEGRLAEKMGGYQEQMSEEIRCIGGDVPVLSKPVLAHFWEISMAHPSSENAALRVMELVGLLCCLETRQVYATVSSCLSLSIYTRCVSWNLNLMEFKLKAY